MFKFSMLNADHISQADYELSYSFTKKPAHIFPNFLPRTDYFTFKAVLLLFCKFLNVSFTSFVYPS